MVLAQKDHNENFRVQFALQEEREWTENRKFYDNSSQAWTSDRPPMDVRIVKKKIIDYEESIRAMGDRPMNF